MDKLNVELDSIELKTKATRGAGANIVAQFIGFATQTVGVIVLARLLEPEDFGIVAMVTAFSLWLMNFGLNGFTEYIIQKKNLNLEEVNSIFWLHLTVATLLSISFIAFGHILVEFYEEPALVGVAAAMSSSFILYALFTSHFALMKRDMRFMFIAGIELVAAVLSVVLSISAALIGMGYWAVVIRQLSIPAIIMLAAWIFLPWRPGRPVGFSKAIPALKYAIKVYSNTSLAFLKMNIDKMLIGRFYGAELLGFYDRAFHLASIPDSQLIAPLHNVALATLSRVRHDSEMFLGYYNKAISMIAFIGTLAALITTISARDVILLLLGPEWSQAGEVVMAFGPGIAAKFIYATQGWLHLSLGNPVRWMKWNLIDTMVTIVAFAIAVQFGMVAIAIAASIVTYLLVLPGLWYAGRPIHLDIFNVLRSIRAYFMSAILVFMCWLSLPMYWQPLSIFYAKIGPLNRIMLFSVSSLLLYLAILAILQRGFSSIKNFITLISAMFFKEGR